MKFGISTKISALVFVLVMITAGTIGFVVNQILFERELEDLRHEARLKGIHLLSGIETLRQDVRFLASTPPIQGIIQAQSAANVEPADGSTEAIWRQRLATIFTEFLQAKPAYLQVRFIGLAGDGLELVRVERLDDVVTIAPNEALQAKGDRPYFRETIRRKPGQVYLSDVTLKREFGEVVEPPRPVIRAAIPVYTEAGRVFGLVVVNRDFGPALQQFAATTAPELLSYVTNDQGDFLAHPDPTLAFGFDYGQRHKIQETYPKLAVLFEPGNNYQEMLIFSKIAGANIAVQFIKLPFDPLQPERYLGLALAAPYQVLVTEAISVRNRSILLSLILIGAGTGLAFFVSGLLIRPLRQITQAAQSLGQGNFEAPLPVKARDEIGILADTFRTMARQIGDHNRNLQEREAQLKAIVDTAADGIITIDERGLIMSFNRAAESLFGYTAAEAIGQNVKMLIPVPHREKHDAYIENYLKMGKGRVIGFGREEIGWHKDGTLFPLNLAISEVRLQNRRLFTGIIHDITESKRAEEKLARQARELARSNADLEQFAYIASHDLQEPLRMVSSYVQLLAQRYQGRLDKDADEFIHFAVDGARRMQNLINDLLTYSKVGTRGKPLEPTDSQTVLDRSLLNLRIAIEEKNAIVTHDFLPLVMADQTQLIQLFQNLISNAIKFHAQPPPKIHISAERFRGQAEEQGSKGTGEHGGVNDGLNRKSKIENPKSKQWLFSVQDNGIGIASEYAERIFLIFQRLHTRQEYPGTGIGLAVCQKIVERHGGSIWMESTPGEGSTFYFTLSAAEPSG